MKKMNKKGFSLIELIVVIAIMAVLVGVLTPALLSYVERSRAQKDDSAMGEVVNAITLALADQGIYDEVLSYAVETDGKQITTIDFNNKNGGSDCTMQFQIAKATYEGENGHTLHEARATGEFAVNTGNEDSLLETRLSNIVGDTIKLTSRTHRLQDYKVTVDFGANGDLDGMSVKVTADGWHEAD